MGLPQINIEFYSKAVSAVQRSAMGIVALILRDAASNVFSDAVKAFNSIDDVKSTEWSADNYDYISKAFLGTPSKVLVLRIGVGTEQSPVPLADNLSKLNNYKYNYLAVPSANASEVSAIVSYIKSKRNTDKKTVKAVVANNTANDKGIINFTTDGIEVGEKTYTAQQYTARIAGVLAGLPFTRSATYYELPEVTAIEDHDTPDEDINNGELILVNDGEVIKIGRGVNSLTTLTANEKADYKKIKIVEVMDMIHDDIRDTFDKEYVGKIINIYDNQILFIVAVNAYFKTLAGDNILDPNSTNKAEIDVVSQRLAWEGIGTDTSAWSDEQVKANAFGSSVFLGGNVKIADAMEDLDFKIFVV